MPSISFGILFFAISSKFQFPVNNRFVRTLCFSSIIGNDYRVMIIPHEKCMANGSMVHHYRVKPKPNSASVILSVVLTAAGVMIAALGDFYFDLVGYSMAFTSVFFQTMYLVLVEKSGAEDGLSSVEIMFYNSFLSLPFLGETYKLFWPDQPVFVRMAARFGATIVPFATIGEDDIAEVLCQFIDRVEKHPSKKIDEKIGQFWIVFFS
ncbi:hypothetical protein HYC85_001108 [Camellia sinensis]|uniref:Uncharacterized protein n=1 Tax=Camellia sinensis TaxID=4442 RepID=A0A7J7I4Q1_CAMSI|nr:hypothetical protein HYC85_001108 [Camellia sinensis]